MPYALVTPRAHIAPLFDISATHQNPPVIEAKIVPVPSDLDKYPVRLMQRRGEKEDCEQDLTYLQLISYLILRDSRSGKYFIYSRTSKGGENRLFGKASIGVGGHIDVGPTESRSLIQTLAEEAVRELKEEVGLLLDRSDISRLSEALRNVNIARLFYCYRVPVDAHHIGLTMVINVDPSWIDLDADPHITSGRWMHYNEIMADYTQGNLDLEAWSVFLMEEYLPTIDFPSQSLQL